jgi:hypothetical protein
MNFASAYEQFEVAGRSALYGQSESSVELLKR